MKTKTKRQRGTTRIEQFDNGLIRVRTQVHNGRVTVPVIGPASDNPDMAQELFRAEIRKIR